MRTLRQAAEGLRSAAGGGLNQAIQRTMLGLALEAEGEAKVNATSRPMVRGGALRRSIVGGLGLVGDAIEVFVEAGGGVADSYAPTQEYGATIRPKNGRFLAIPTPKAKTAAGVPRWRSPREVGGLVFRRSARGGVLFRPGKKGAPPEVLFWLVRSARIPATRYLGRAMDRLAGQLPGAVRKAVDGVAGA